jgi:hypothetical protein
MRGLFILKKLKIPLWKGGGHRCILRMFCDAIVDAYPAAGFWRAKD